MRVVLHLTGVPYQGALHLQYYKKMARGKDSISGDCDRAAPGQTQRLTAYNDYGVRAAVDNPQTARYIPAQLLRFVSKD